MSINFDEIHLTKRQILERISEQSIYEFYLNDRLKTGTLMKCCFHKDNSPSLGFYKSSGGELIYKCFGCGAQGNVFKFVSDLHNGIDFGKTLNLIQRTFNLSRNGGNNTGVCAPIVSNSINVVDGDDEGNKKTLILPTHRNFNKIDYDFWNQFYIPLPLLLTYDVRACERVYIVKKSGEYVLFAEHTKFNPIYSYQINDHYKVYRPYADKKGKWASNTDLFDVQGLKQLPARGELLIITSSLKDVMVLNVMGYNAIALGGEGMRLPEKILDYLWACFDNLVVFYDNDKAGLKYGESLANEIGAGNIHIPVEEPKDISDYVKKYDLEKGIDLMKELI